jgi:hypothetical protein
MYGHARIVGTLMKFTVICGYQLTVADYRSYMTLMHQLPLNQSIFLESLECP